MSLDIAEAKRRLPLPALLARLGLGDRARKSARCPWPWNHKHNDHSPSFGIFREGEGWRWKCFVCGAGDEITFLEKHEGLSRGDAIRRFCELAGVDGSEPTPARRMVARYDYVDETGALLFEVERTDPKGFRQRRPDGRGGWLYNLDGVRRVLYRLPEVVKATGEVWVVEGEKDADTLAGLGFTATTNPGGAGNWREEYSGFLRGRPVVIVPDNDAHGLKHAEQVARSLHGIAASVKVLTLPVGAKDVSDFVATFADKIEAAERLALLAEGAAEWTPTQGAVETKRTGLLVVNAMDLVAKTFPAADDIVTGILPTKGRLILSAPAKLGKTRFALGLALAIATGRDALGFKITKPRRVLYIQAEVSERSLQDRLKKMLAGFTDAEKELVRQNLFFCNDPRLKLTSYRHVEAIRQAVELHRPDVLVFDPLYKFNTGSEDRVQDMTAFFDPLDALIYDHGVSVLLVHHHGKSSGEGLATPAHRNRGSSTIADWADSLLTLTFEDAANEIVKLTFTLRNAEEPPPMAYKRNPDTLWLDPLPDYVFAGKASSRKISDRDVADTIGDGNAIAYSRLAETLAEKFDVSERTAKRAIDSAVAAGTIHKNASGLYERGGDK
jgi:hypothetical protein